MAIPPMISNAPVSCTVAKTGARRVLAVCGSLETVGATVGEAKHRLGIMIHNFVTNMHASTSQPIIWADFGEPGKLWVVHFTRFGDWSYTVYQTQTFSSPVALSSCTISGFKCDKDAFEAMKRHWYQQNIEPVVDGLLAIGGWRAWECTGCHSYQKRPPPADGVWRCGAPHCGKVRDE